VQEVCATYGLPYTTGPLSYQYLLTLRTIVKLALPERFLCATSDDAPETASEDRLRNRQRPAPPTRHVSVPSNRRKFSITATVTAPLDGIAAATNGSAPQHDR
jgi:hypothetical protein